MNDLLQIKVPFGHSIRKGQYGPSTLPANQQVNKNDLIKIKEQIDSLISFWKNNNLIDGALVSIEYTRVVAKSNRVRQLLSFGVKDINECIKGAKFVGDNTQKRHVITYFVPKETLVTASQQLGYAVDVFEKEHTNNINSILIDEYNKLPVESWSYEKIKKSVFVGLIVDCFYIRDIYLPMPDPHMQGSNIITIYNTGFEILNKMNEIGLSLSPNLILNEYTIVLTDEQYENLYNKASYLIAMSLTDITKMPPVNVFEERDQIFTISKPTNEPIIGVIDTFFENSVYFSSWVEVHNVIPDIGITDYDRFHGTAVDSLIVDGARINPHLDDGCGNFRVRHFSVSTGSQYSSVSITKNIKQIVNENKDIKVWNISLGSNTEAHPNYISYEAAELDRLQNELDIIFVIAGTNDKECTMSKRIGSPADSINSLVVNSVNAHGITASYSRRGPILSFYNKPDISYCGGDKADPIRVCSKNGEAFVVGTSFAAPYISRKLAYLIHVMGLSREVAKALLIDSAIGWVPNTNENVSDFIGMGIVPTNIKDILQCKEDEIRFTLTGEATEYDNYCYNIPVPISKGKQPYIAKATLCYFPESSRDQGVDYTKTELDLHFGRITNTGIKTINDNYQNTDSSREYEKDARTYHRKWDNIKVICESLKTRARPKDIYQKGLWGISVKKTERSNNKKTDPIHFGMVITLKNIQGNNLIQDFVQQCAWNNLLVTPLRINQTITIYNKLSEEINLDS